jgi:RNA polymerase sigma-70 factor (ECF subfamily)
MTSTSASLLERLQEPADTAAWDRFVELYSPLLFTWAKQLGLQSADAADLVQEVLLVLLQKLPEFRYDQQQSFRGWLRAVLLNRWRDQRRRPRLPLEPDPVDPVGPDNVADLREAEYRRFLVHRALQLMQTDFQPMTWRACWELVVNGRSPAEVAGELGVSVWSVYTSKSRVLARLRQQLDGLLD